MQFHVHDSIRNITKNRMGSHVWISPYTELHAPLRMSSRWAPGTNYTLCCATDEVPKMKDLLNQVASKAKDKWKIVGIQLEIGQDQLNTIKHSNPIECYSEIFELWKNRGTPPFTWETILEALTSPAVEEGALANKVEAWRGEQLKR